MIALACLLALLPGLGTSLTDGAPRHDFHVSKCLVEYEPKVRRLQISMHLFIDDLEEALRRRGHDGLRLCTPKEAPEADQHLEAYLRDAFTLAANGHPVTYAYLGKELSDDLMGVWCYMESPEIPDLQNLTVTNTVLLEIFDDQKNIVSIFGPGDTHGVLWFEPGKTTDTAVF